MWFFSDRARVRGSLVAVVCGLDLLRWQIAFDALDRRVELRPGGWPRSTPSDGLTASSTSWWPAT
jgi:hypothetical protein